MARTPKPYPDPITQLRAFQRNQVPSAYGDNAPFRAFSVGNANPDPRNPTLALVALTALLRAAKPTGTWMVVPFEGTQACVDAVWALLRAALGKKSPVAAVGGHATPAVFWVFEDLSCLLTERAAEGLRLYPSVLYLRSRDDQWTPSFLLGRGKNAKPKLRLQRAAPHQGWKPGDDKHAAYFDDRDLLAAPGTDISLDRDAVWTGWAKRLRRDVDRFHPVFAQMEGHAVWPAFGTSPKAATEPVPGQPAPPKASAWPSTLPRRGLTPERAAQRQDAVERAARWLGALRHSMGASPRTLLVRPNEPNLERRLEIVVVLAGQTPARGGLGRQHQAHSLLLMPDAPSLRHFFPEGLAQDLALALEGDSGLAYGVDDGGRWAHADTPTVGICQGRMTSHETMQAFGEVGAPTQGFTDVWGVLPN
jgi:hypothetical protein